MSQVLLLLISVFWALHMSIESDPNTGKTVLSIQLEKIYHVTFCKQSFTKFRNCLCNSHFNSSNVVTNILNQQYFANVSDIGCETNTDVKEASSVLDCYILDVRTGSKQIEFNINCKPSINNQWSELVVKKDNLLCPNKCLIIQWMSYVNFDLFYYDQVSIKCETTRVPTTSTVSLSTIASIPHISNFLNSTSSKEETNDSASMSELQMVFVVLLVLLCFAVSFILGAKRVSLMRFCKCQKQVNINKINYIKQNTMNITTDHAAIHKECVNTMINPNLECIPRFDVRVNGLRSGITTYPANESADSQLHGTKELGHSRDVNSFLDHIYATPDETVIEENSHLYDDGYTERQSIIIELPIRNKIIANGNSRQGFYEVERDEEQLGIVQDLTEEHFNDGANVNVSEDGYEVPRYKTFNLCLENNKEKENLKYTLFGRRSLEKKVALNEPCSKLAYFELEVNDQADNVSEHQHVFPIRRTWRDAEMTGDGYEVPVKRNFYSIQEHEVENDEHVIKSGTIPQNIFNTLNQTPEHACLGNSEAKRQATTNKCSSACIECNSSVVVQSQWEKNDTPVNESTKQRYYEVELEEKSNGYLQDDSEDSCSGVLRFEIISNDGYQLLQPNLTNDCFAARTMETPLQNVYETIPEG